MGTRHGLGKRIVADLAADMIAALVRAIGDGSGARAAELRIQLGLWEGVRDQLAEDKDLTEGQWQEVMAVVGMRKR